MFPFFNFPSIYEQVVDKMIFDAIRSEKLEDGVLAVLKVLQTCNHVLDNEVFDSHLKDELASNTIRKLGNKAYSNGQHQQALILYNRALLSAPKGSLGMKLAYSNRSALLFKGNFFTACLRDIDTCMAMGCPPELVGKLSKRKEEALNKIWTEQHKNNVSYPTLIKEFFKLKTSNADIPNISADINVTMEPEGPKVIAATDIKVGTVVALETPFVSTSHPENIYFSCYYCHKMSLNLMPCDGCCYALYCDEICMKNSLDEGHNVLCPIIANIIDLESDYMLAILAVIKLRQNSKSWNEFISVYYEMDTPRNYICDIFDTNKPFWLDSNKNYKHFIVAKMYENCIMSAFVLYFLEFKTDFFPKPHDAKRNAMLAVSKILMNLALHGNILPLQPAVDIQSRQHECYHETANSGLTTFTRILKHSCQPNILVVPKNKQVALVAITPIKKGTEITVCPTVRHWLEEEFKEGRHQKRLFLLHDIICSCVICSGDWLKNKQTLTDIQTKTFRELYSKMEQFRSRDIILFKNLCKGLDILSDVPFADQYEIVFTSFLKCILYIKYIHSDNCMFDLNYIN